jgi:hypothetical protein
MHFALGKSDDFDAAMVEQVTPGLASRLDTIVSDRHAMRSAPTREPRRWLANVRPSLRFQPIDATQ